MNSHMFLVATLIAAIYLGIQYVESRYVNKEAPPKPYKVLAKDALVVFGASLVSLFVLEQVRPYLGANSAMGALVNAAGGGGGGVDGIKNPPVFVNNPTF
jgi:hypothetical protein